MSPLDLFKLEKLRIIAFSDVGRKLLGGFGAELASAAASAIGIDTDENTFEAMFNPESFSMTHQNVFQDNQRGIKKSGGENQYAYQKSDRLSLKIILDGTGVATNALLPIAALWAKSVEEQVNKFLKLCFVMDGEIHQPKYLLVQWGILSFACRLESVDISYTLFDKGGKPLRAELSTVFVGKHIQDEEQASPDLTHIRMLRTGDNLPLMTKRMYGDSSYYIKLAQANKLDNFRKLESGSEIHFPPLKK